jgi:hypothetical protein
LDKLVCFAVRFRKQNASKPLKSKLLFGALPNGRNNWRVSVYASDVPLLKHSVSDKYPDASSSDRKNKVDNPAKWTKQPCDQERNSESNNQV